MDKFKATQKDKGCCRSKKKKNYTTMNHIRNLNKKI